MTTSSSPETSASTRLEVRAEDVGKTFNKHVVLEGVDLQVHQGEIVAIVGTSGCGKTVLMHILLGLLPPTAGRVMVADHEKAGAPLVDIVHAATDEVYEIRLSWAVVFQHNALFSTTVYENCALWLREHTDMTEVQIRERVRDALASVKLNVDTVIEKQRAELSGGMAKRVAVARALAADPMVVFYDEPTTGLDPVTATHIHDLIWTTHHRPRADGARRTTVLITHDRDLLRRVHPRVILLSGGGVAFDGPYAEFVKQEHGPVHEYLAQMPALHARPNRYDEQGSAGS